MTRPTVVPLRDEAPALTIAQELRLMADEIEQGAIPVYRVLCIIEHNPNGDKTCDGRKSIGYRQCGPPGWQQDMVWLCQVASNCFINGWE